MRSSRSAAPKPGSWDETLWPAVRFGKTVLVHMPIVSQGVSAQPGQTSLAAVAKAGARGVAQNPLASCAAIHDFAAGT